MCSLFFHGLGPEFYESPNLREGQITILVEAN